MAVHYCPKCGECSHHPTTAPTWSLKCPSCGTKAAQHPHPPERPAKRKATAKRPAKKTAAAKKTATAPRPEPAGTDADS